MKKTTFSPLLDGRRHDSGGRRPRPDGLLGIGASGPGLLRRGNPRQGVAGGSRDLRVAAYG